MDRRNRAPGEPGGGPANGATGAGGDGTPGGGQPPATGNNPAPTPPAVASIPIDALPDPLRNLPESQIRFTLNKMVEGLATANRRIKELETKPKPGHSTVISEPAPEKPKNAKPLDVRLLEEPEAALEEFLQSRFSGAISKLNDVTERVGRAELAAIRSEIDDFREHEAEVLEVLESNQLEKTRENLLGAYTMVVGKKTLDERSRARRAASNPETPPPDAPAAKPKYVKNDLTEEVRQSLGMSEEDYYINYATADSVKIKVPT